MKLLICDDDISTIEVLKKQIDFSKFEIDKILEAYNGEMAIKVIEENKPELILCDIGMPKVNGIEVLKEVYEKYPNTEFCFLTCYEDFEYAKAAIQYNASGYINKPFRLEQVEETILKMVKNYQKKNALIMKEEKQAKKDLIYSSFLKQVIDGMFGTDCASIQNQIDINDIPLKANSQTKIVFTCFSIIDTIKSEWSKDLLLYIAPKITDEIFNDYVGFAHSVVNVDDRFIWCLTFVQNNEDLEERCSKLNYFSFEHFGIKPVMLISNPFVFYQSADVVCELYEIIRKIRYYGGKTFHQDDDISNLLSQKIINESQLLWYLKNRDNNGYLEYIKELINSLEGEKEIEAFKKEILVFFLTVLKDNNVSDSVVFSNKNIEELNHKENSKKDVLTYANVLLMIYQSEVNNINDSEKIILRARKYVDDNYRDNIGREDVAEIAYVTPNYLSKLFKNNMGMNLREYINKLRVEESKRLLLSTNMSISEIAIYVGYYNISYFSTIFHKLVGVSPADWRNNGKETSYEKSTI